MSEKFRQALIDFTAAQASAWSALNSALYEEGGEPLPWPPPETPEPPAEEKPPEPEPAPEEPTDPLPQFNATAFFDSVRQSLFGGSMTQDQVNGINDIADHLLMYGLKPLIEQSAYVYATAYHETARTMQPIAEYGKGQGYSYGQPAGPYGQCYYGRGYVQLTWHENYVKQDAKILDKWEQDAQLEEIADNAMLPEWAGHILVGGMQDGDFTGKSLDDYIKEGSVDYVEARRIVNGTDRASEIADYARKWESALRAGFQPTATAGSYAGETSEV